VTTIGHQANVPGIAEFPGPTIATIPVRVSPDKEASVAQLLHRVQQQAMEMIAIEQIGLLRIRRIRR
jgi:hypothetical protein